MNNRKRKFLPVDLLQTLHLLRHFRSFSFRTNNDETIYLLFFEKANIYVEANEYYYKKKF
jgi:hypothetical protein